MPEILFEEDDRRTVQLSADYDRDIAQRLARFDCYQAVLIAVSQDKKPKHFRLSKAEADAFAESWQAYRADMKAKEAAEQARIQAVIDEAMAIVTGIPDLKVTHDERYGNYWHLRMEHPCYFYREAYGPEQLLAEAKEAQREYQVHQDNQNTFAEAQSLLAGLPFELVKGIDKWSIKSHITNKHRDLWHDTPQERLQEVKNIIASYHEKLEQQAQDEAEEPAPTKTQAL